MSLKHNKKRNVGIVYELLIRGVSDALVNNDKDKAERTISILKKYFFEGSCLRNELDLYEAVKSSRGVSKFVAEKLINVLKEKFKTFNTKQHSSSKSNLIREMNYTLGKDVFNRYKIDDYRLLASVSVVLESSSVVAESMELLKFEEAIINFITSPTQTQRAQINEENDKLAYDIAVESFKKKYSNILSSDQSKLLESYVHAQFSGQYKTFKENVILDQKKIYKQLIEFSKTKECNSDKVMTERIRESAKNLKDLSGSNEKIIEEMMLYHELSKEIASDE